MMAVRKGSTQRNSRRFLVWWMIEPGENHPNGQETCGCTVPVENGIGGCSGPRGCFFGAPTMRFSCSIGWSGAILVAPGAFPVGPAVSTNHQFLPRCGKPKRKPASGASTLECDQRVSLTLVFGRTPLSLLMRPCGFCRVFVMARASNYVGSRSSG